MIRNAICGRSDFVGHLGGDDFVAVMRSQDWKARLLALIANFSGAVPSLYAAEHREAAGIRAVDRDGMLRTYPLATLSVAALEVNADGRLDSNAIADELRRVKALAKAQRGSSFLLSAGDEVIDLQLAPA
jgi:GGDEF domain-containing protein